MQAIVSILSWSVKSAACAPLGMMTIKETAQSKMVGRKKICDRNIHILYAIHGIGQATKEAAPRSIQQRYASNLSAARTLAFAASSSRLLGGALVSSKRSRRVDAPATSSTAARNEASFAFDGLLKPLIF